MSFQETGPADDYFTVNTSDTVDLPNGVCRGFHCDVAGDVAIISPRGNAATFTCVAGVTYAYKAKRIKTTGTTATGVKALY